MNTPNDGGPIAPNMIQETPIDSQGTVMQSKMIAEGGMSLRDWFAGMIIGGIVSDPTVRSLDHSAPGHAKTAYIVADAMLAARTGKEEA
jgi:hypothetical protein